MNCTVDNCNNKCDIICFGVYFSFFLFGTSALYCCFKAYFENNNSVHYERQQIIIPKPYPPPPPAYDDDDHMV